MTAALDFAGLSIEIWKAGFSTRHELFDWITSSPLFDALTFDMNKSDSMRKQTTRDLPLCRAFSAYVKERAAQRDLSLSSLSLSSSSDSATAPARAIKAKDRETARAEAVEYFGKTDELKTILHIARVRKHVKEVFDPPLIQEWTSVEGVPVRYVMDEVKRVISPEPAQSPPANANAPAGSDTTSAPAAGATVSSNGPHSAILAPLEGWESALFTLDLDQVRKIVLQAKETLGAQGKLYFDWRAAKARKEAAKKEKSLLLNAQAQAQVTKPSD